MAPGLVHCLGGGCLGVSRAGLGPGHPQGLPAPSHLCILSPHTALDRAGAQRALADLSSSEPPGNSEWEQTPSGTRCPALALVSPPAGPCAPSPALRTWARGQAGGPPGAAPGTLPSHRCSTTPGTWSGSPSGCGFSPRGQGAEEGEHTGLPGAAGLPQLHGLGKISDFQESQILLPPPQPGLPRAAAAFSLPSLP